jgi:hypothetical protein
MDLDTLARRHADELRRAAAEVGPPPLPAADDGWSVRRRMAVAFVAAALTVVGAIGVVGLTTWSGTGPIAATDEPGASSVPPTSADLTIVGAPKPLVAPFTGSLPVVIDDIPASVLEELADDMAAFLAGRGAVLPASATLVFEVPPEIFVTVADSAGGHGLLRLVDGTFGQLGEWFDRPAVLVESVVQTPASRYRIVWLGVPEGTARVVYRSPALGGGEAAVTGGAGFLEVPKPDWTSTMTLVALDESDGELETRSVLLDGGGCSARREPPLVPDNPTLAEAVAETRMLLVVAAVTCNVSAFEELAEGVGPFAGGPADGLAGRLRTLDREVGVLDDAYEALRSAPVIVDRHVEWATDEALIRIASDGSLVRLEVGE